MKDNSYSIVKKIIIRTSIVGAFVLLVSGGIVSLGFIDDISKNKSPGLDQAIDIIISESFEHVFWVLILSVLILIFVVYWTVKKSMQDINSITNDFSNINLESPIVRYNSSKIPKEILPLINSLNESLKRIKRDIDQKNEFIKNASHELNTPITILNANIESLPNSKKKIELKEDLKLLENVSSQLFRLSQVENFKVQKKERVNLVDLTENAIKQSYKVFKNRKIKLNVKNQIKSIIINGTYEYLLMCFRNLLDNAIQNSPNNSVIKINLYQNGNIEIINTLKSGVRGKVLMENLFKQFWRYDKNSYPGSGLGLSIVKRIMDAHNATIRTLFVDEEILFRLKFNKI
jgi:signal transduction histidine kinase